MSDKGPREIRATIKSALEGAAKSRNLKIVKPALVEQIEELGVKVSREKLSQFGLSEKPIGEIVTIPGFKVVVDKTQTSQE